MKIILEDLQRIYQSLKINKLNFNFPTEDMKYFTDEL